MTTFSYVVRQVLIGGPRLLRHQTRGLEILKPYSQSGTVTMGPGLVETDSCGFAARHDRVVSADQPALYFVGHNYDTRGGLRNIGEDARLAASRIADR